MKWMMFDGNAGLIFSILNFYTFPDILLLLSSADDSDLMLTVLLFGLQATNFMET